MLLSLHRVRRVHNTNTRDSVRSNTRDSVSTSSLSSSLSPPRGRVLREESESGDPNLDVSEIEDVPVDSDSSSTDSTGTGDLVPVKEFSALAGVDLRWLREEILKGRVSISLLERNGKQGRPRQMLNTNMVERVRLRYIRRRRMQISLPNNGMTRDGIDYLHDGSIKRR
jgi:hypothetical protein